MSRIESCLAQLKAKGRKAVVPYIVAGDPWLEATVPAMHAMTAAGADIIELGIPFSDPMAEGPVIQLAHERALLHRVSLRDVLNSVAQFRENDSETPVVLMGYANPIEVMGYENFAQTASAAGVDGVLTVDMPPEEASELNGILSQHQIDSIFLIAPTTSEIRTKEICRMATGYIYYVSLKGITGAGHLDTDEVNRKVQAIKQITELSVCVGFGIKDAASASAVVRYADGVIVGSVLVNAVADCSGISTRGEEQANQVEGDRPQIIEAINNRLATIVKDIAAGVN